MINDIKVIDDYTIQLKTEYSFSPLLSHLSHSGGGMMSLESIKKDYEAMENGVILALILINIQLVQDISSLKNGCLANILN